MSLLNAKKWFIYLLFLLNLLFINKSIIMSKRTQRKLREETKKLISKKLKNKPKSDSHKKAISEAMRCYWNSIPPLPENDSK